MRKIFCLIIISASVIYSQSAGNSGLSFLKMGFGARNIAMGDAGSVAAADVTSLFYNPANLALNRNPEIIFMHNEWIQDSRSDILGAKFVLFNIPFAIGLNLTAIDDIEIRTKAVLEPEATFNANYFSGSISTGFFILNNLAFGATAKYLYEGLYVDEANGLGFDFGLSYLTSINGLSVSTVIKNLGSMDKLRNEETDLPSEFRVGSAYNFSVTEEFKITAAAELLKYLKDDNTHFNLGGEIFYNETIGLRAGYQTGFETRSFTGGIGIKWGSLSFDYAFMPFSYSLGNANIFSLQFKF